MDVTLKWVHRERTRGKWRYRFQRDGRKVTLRGEPGSPEFMAQYHCLAGIKDAPPAPLSGSLGWLRDAYLDHMANMVAAGQMSPLTLRQRRSQLARLDEWAEKRMEMPRGKIVELRDRIAQTPGEANNTVKSIRAMFAWAIDAEKMKGPNPAQGVKRLKVQTKGFIPWTVEHVRRFTGRHPYGTKAHLALSLVMFTTARRSDLRALSRFHEHDIVGVTWLRWNQAKAPHGLVEIPMLPQLQREVREVGGESVYLPTEYGAPFSIAGLGGWFADRCKEAGVPGRLHGVRKAVPSLLAERGVSSREIMVLLGHANARQGEVYTAAADRRVLAEAVMGKLGELRW